MPIAIPNDPKSINVTDEGSGIDATTTLMPPVDDSVTGRSPTLSLTLVAGYAVKVIGISPEVAELDNE